MINRSGAPYRARLPAGAPSVRAAPQRLCGTTRRATDRGPAARPVRRVLAGIVAAVGVVLAALQIRGNAVWWASAIYFGLILVVPGQSRSTAAPRHRLRVSKA